MTQGRSDSIWLALSACLRVGYPTYLIEAVAAKVSQCLLDTLRQGLSCSLDMNYERNPEDSLVFVIRNFHPLHELWH